MPPSQLWRWVFTPCIGGWLLGFVTACAYSSLHEYPCETEPRGWRRIVSQVASPLGVPERALRSLGGVDIPEPPPFGRVFINYMLPRLRLLPGTTSRETVPPPTSSSSSSEKAAMEDQDQGGNGAGDVFWLSMIAGEGSSWLSSSSPPPSPSPSQPGSSSSSPSSSSPSVSAAFPFAGPPLWSPPTPPPPQQRYRFSYVCTDSRHHDYSYFYSYDGRHEALFFASLRDFSCVLAVEALVSGLAYLGLVLLLNGDLRHRTLRELAACCRGTAAGRALLGCVLRCPQLCPLLAARKQVAPRLPEPGDTCPVCHEAMWPALDESTSGSDDGGGGCRHSGSSSSSSGGGGSGGSLAGDVDDCGSGGLGEVAAWCLGSWGSSSSSSRRRRRGKRLAGACRGACGGEQAPLLYCRWSCGRAVHEACQNQWLKTGADSCVYCNTPWI